IADVSDRGRLRPTIRPICRHCRDPVLIEKLEDFPFGNLVHGDFSTLQGPVGRLIGPLFDALMQVNPNKSLPNRNAVCPVASVFNFDLLDCDTGRDQVPEHSSNAVDDAVQDFWSDVGPTSQRALKSGCRYRDRSILARILPMVAFRVGAPFRDSR
ncbi:MAG TPA: hypothetical protein VEK82_01620, partial [Stellaceae bacterium]|nr:hypothetical protein [Stellaceae bacterium]